MKRLRGETVPSLAGSSYDVLNDFGAALDISVHHDTNNWQPVPAEITHFSASIEEKANKSFFAETINGVEVFAAWANTQAGVKFQMKDIRFEK